MFITIVSASIGFLLFAVVLTVVIVVAGRLLVPDTPIQVRVNQEQQITGHFGQTLLRVLSDNDIHIPSACAGAGICGLCRVHVDVGASPANPIEKALLSARDLIDGERLACQVSLRKSLSIEVPEHMLNTHAWHATVLSTRALSPLIREVRLTPNIEPFAFEPGDFMQVTAPEGTVRLAAADPGDAYREQWRSLGISQLGVHSNTAQTRAYSLANRPTDTDAVTLMIRLALPPSDALASIPTGFVSSWLFTRQSGDTLELSGPHRGFHIVDESRELVFVGGGVGMAPLRSMIHRQISRQHEKPLTFFYGARTTADLLYRVEFDELSDANNGFTWTAALSEPDDNWQGERGFIHEVFVAQFLEQHEAPQSCDYYLCGPPLMVGAVISVLQAAGVHDTHIYKDEFG